MFRVGGVRQMRGVHFLLVAAVTALGACGDQRPTEPVGPAAGGSVEGLLSSSGPKLVECHTDETHTESAIIDALGGLVSIGGTKVVFPAGALPGPTSVTLTIPASRYVEIAITTDGPSYFPDLLKQPVVTIDYSRCNRSDILLKPLTAWYIDSETKDLLEEMLGTDDKLTRSVTFTTSHFSGYAIAF
jgi:hypothetical protein